MTAETSNAREWVLVPRELTQGMRSALARAVNASCNTDEWYAHTLAAAPQPPSAPVGVKTLSEFMAEQEALHPGIHDKVQAATDELRASLAQPPAPSTPVGVEWDMPCGECSCGVYDARAFAAFDGTFPKCRRFDRYCVGAIHCAQALAQQPAAVDEAMVERAWVAFCENNGSARQGIRAALTAALAAQHQEPKS